MATRLYTVTSPKGSRLIEASTRAAALGFVAREEIKVEVATTKEVADLVAKGTKVEVAGDTNQSE
jgi:hypothetical protein